MIEKAVVSTSDSYPSSPWRLEAAGHCSIWRLPARDIAQLAIPAGLQPFIFARSAWVATGYIAYGPGGDLSYHELFLATPVRAGHRLTLTVVAIWVDSEASLRGGRELWGIPKELARFETNADGVEVLSAEGVLAQARFRPRWRWPLRVSFKVRVVQVTREALQYTPVVATGRTTFGRAEWDFPSKGPFEILHGRRPTLSFGLVNADVRFGA